MQTTAHHIGATLGALFARDLTTLIHEIESFPDGKLWTTLGGISNSGGVLAQHIVGNLNHFIGHGLGDTGYVRQREREFIAAERTKEELIADIERTRTMVSDILPRVDTGSPGDPFPIATPFDLDRLGIMMHLYHHLAYHLGQINYLRRIASAEV